MDRLSQKADVSLMKAETAKCLLGSQNWHGKSFADTLCRDPAMRCYERADLFPDPTKCPSTTYNLWKPMPCDHATTLRPGDFGATPPLYVYCIHSEIF